MKDVIVIGAGPAGLVAARNLAAARYDVLVLEEHAAIGHPVHCTGLVGLDAFDELDLAREPICGIATSARFRAAGGRSVLVDSEQIRAAVVDRGAFDAALARQAVAAGALVATNRRVIRLDIGTECVRVHTGPAGAPVDARACLLACGANYRFNRQLGLGLPRAFMQSAQLEARFPPDEHIEVHMGRAIAPGGFAWTVPFMRGAHTHAKIGLLCERQVRTCFATFIDRLGRLRGIDTRAWPEPRLKILPLAPVRKTYGERLLAVGDAAGLVKPTTGGGIYYGLLSGVLAAEVLGDALRRDDLGERSLGRYETCWRGRLGPEIRAGLAFRTIAARLDDRAIDALVDLASVDGIVPLLKRTASFNWHRDAAVALLRNVSFRRIAMSALWG